MTAEKYENHIEVCHRNAAVSALHAWIMHVSSITAALNVGAGEKNDYGHMLEMRGQSLREP